MARHRDDILRWVSGLIASAAEMVAHAKGDSPREGIWSGLPDHYKMG